MNGSWKKLYGVHVYESVDDRSLCLVTAQKGSENRINEADGYNRQKFVNLYNPFLHSVV